MGHLIITNEVLYNKELTLNEKIIMSMIMTKSGGALTELSNDDVANVLNICKARASGVVNGLAKKGYIEISYEYLKDSRGNDTKGISSRNVKIIKL